MASWTSWNSMIIWGRMAEADVLLETCLLRTLTKMMTESPTKCREKESEFMLWSGSFFWQWEIQARLKSEDRLDRTSEGRETKGKVLSDLCYYPSAPTPENKSLGAYNTSSFLRPFWLLILFPVHILTLWVIQI